MKFTNVILLFLAPIGLLGNAFLEDLMNRNPRNSDEMIISASKILAKIIGDTPSWVIWIADLHIPEEQLVKMVFYEVGKTSSMPLSMGKSFEKLLTAAFTAPFEQIFDVKPISMKTYESEVDKLFEEAAKDFENVEYFHLAAKIRNLYEQTMVNKETWSAPNRGEVINRGLRRLSKAVNHDGSKKFDSESKTFTEGYKSEDLGVRVSTLRKHLSKVFANVDYQYSGAIQARQEGEKQLLRAMIHIAVTFEILENFTVSLTESMIMQNRMFMLLRVYRKALVWRDPSCAVAELTKLSKFFHQSHSLLKTFDTPRGKITRMNMMISFIGQIDFEINEILEVKFRAKQLGKGTFF